jgi:hypothetical protein
MERGGMPVTDGLLAGGLTIDVFEGEGDFDELLAVCSHRSLAK